jgi:putative ABC transport system permease protein
MFKIAFRNVLRNGRRSLMTALAIVVGATALVLLGEYNNLVRVGMETNIVRGMGHIGIFHKGYFEYGSGKPAVYSIADYEQVIALIRNDPEMKAMTTMVTPRISLGGIAGNAAVDKSKTFFSTGFVPSEKNIMGKWDGYAIDLPPYDIGLKDNDPNRATVGIGLARILGLCAENRLDGCREQDKGGSAAQPARLQLLSGAGGAPNIVNVTVARAINQGSKEADDMYVGLNFKLAQQLLYGGGEHKAVSIAVQLKSSRDLARAKARLATLFAANHLALDIRDFDDMVPMYRQILSYFLAMFAFIGAVMAIVVGFTITNTMGMSVMERTNEIGTGRAMGVRRSGVRRQFLLEGAILGVIGASAGIVVALGATYLINHAGITYTPPGAAQADRLYLLAKGNGPLLMAVWTLLVAIAALASIIPATRASRMPVVDALRHV